MEIHILLSGTPIDVGIYLLIILLMLTTSIIVIYFLIKTDAVRYFKEIIIKISKVIKIKLRFITPDSNNKKGKSKKTINKKGKKRRKKRKKKQKT